jgi:hypothetical protein
LEICPPAASVEGSVVSLYKPGGSSPSKCGSYPPKKEALQALSISKNVAWDALTFRFEKIEQSINSTRDTPMNQRIRPCQLGVAFCDRPKSSKLLQGIFLLVRGKAWKSAQHCIASAAKRSISRDGMFFSMFFSGRRHSNIVVYPSAPV